MIKISIVTISYNSEKTIENTFKSILEQSYRPLEYVLVDGGSKDSTIQIIKKYIPLFEERGIEVIYKSEPDRGISDAFNKGISRASGELIGIINSDDRLKESVLEKIVDKFESTNADVACGDCLWLDEDNGIEYVRKSSLNLKKLKYDMVLMHPTCFVKKTAYNSWGTFDTNLKFAMDKDLMARFYKQGAKFAYIPEIITVMAAGGASDVNYMKVFREGTEIAIRNGVPKFYAKLRTCYKVVRYKTIKLVRAIIANVKKRKGTI